MATAQTHADISAIKTSPKNVIYSKVNIKMLFGITFIHKDGIISCNGLQLRPGLHLGWHTLEKPHKAEMTKIYIESSRTGISLVK